MKLTVDLKLYSKDAMLEAVYKFADRGAFVDSVDWEKHTATVEFEGSHGNNESSMKIEFYQELVDQTLRAQIRAETETVRNLILANAFSESALSKD